MCIEALKKVWAVENQFWHINPQRMHEGYSSCIVYLSVTTLIAMLFVYRLEARCHFVSLCVSLTNETSEMC